MNAIMVLAAAVSFLGYFESRNAMANKILEPVGEGEEVKCERPPLDVVEKCPACEGAGELNLEEPNYGQADGRIGGPKKIRVKCPICRGRGKMENFIKESNK